MKSTALIILMAFLFLNCSKNNNDNEDCKLAQRDLYYNSTTGNSTKFEFDATGKIVKFIIVGSNFSTDVLYYTDSVVMVSSSERHTFFLNSNGLADSSLNILTNSAEQLRFYHKYAYNSDGFLISDREIFSQLHNGNIVRDTIFKTYTISNGNVTKMSNTQSSTDLNLEYSNELLPANNPDLNMLSIHFPFLGQQSRNLVSRVIEGVNLINITYERDGNRNITKQIGMRGSSQVSRKEYHYTCN